MTTATVKTPVRRKRIRPQKSLNGQAKGGTYLLTFNLDNAGETRAWEMAQNLAGQRKLKQVLTGMLLAIRTVEEHTHTGKPIDMTHFMAQFVTQLVFRGQNGGLCAAAAHFAAGRTPQYVRWHRRPRRSVASAPGIRGRHGQL